MLLREYSIDPELFLEPSLVKNFVRDFGADKGRVLSLMPKDWMRMALENVTKTKSQKDRKDAEILITTLQKWKMQKIALRSPSRKNIHYNSPWIEFARNFEKNPLDGILTKKAGLLAINPEEIWNDPEAWQVESSATVSITVKEYWPYLQRLVSLSEEIYLIDPYFNLEVSRYWPIWEVLAGLKEQSDHIKKIVFITADHKASQQILGRDPKRLDSMANAEIWQVEAEKVEGGMHDRFVLTELAGFGLSNSFQEKPKNKMVVSRLSSESFAFQKNVFIKQAFEVGSQLY
jgi:hypothetical protein